MAIQIDKPIIQRILIKRSDGSEDEWKDLGYIKTSVALPQKDEFKDFEPVHLNIRCEAFFTVKGGRKALFKMMGLWKTPKCTYKTRRQDCAKRNR